MFPCIIISAASNKFVSAINRHQATVGCRNVKDTSGKHVYCKQLFCLVWSQPCWAPVHLSVCIYQIKNGWTDYNKIWYWGILSKFSNTLQHFKLSVFFILHILLSYKLPSSWMKFVFLRTYPKQFSYPLTDSCWLDIKTDTKLICNLHNIISCLSCTDVVLKQSNTWNRFAFHL